MNSRIIAAVHVANGHTPANAVVLAGYAYDDYARAPIWYAKASRWTARLTRDPNADSKDRDEARLQKLMRVKLSSKLDRIMDTMGDPPDIRRLDEDFWAREMTEGIEGLQDELERMALTSASTLYQTAPLAIDWTLINNRASQWAQEYKFDLVKGLNNTDRDLLRTEISKYIETPGRTLGELREQLTGSFGSERANNIAVTEVTRAYAEGEAQLADEARAAGLDMVGNWQTNKDELVCEDCAALDGQETEDKPPKHTKCRCWMNYTWKRKRADAAENNTD